MTCVSEMRLRVTTRSASPGVGIGQIEGVVQRDHHAQQAHGDADAGDGKNGSAAVAPAVLEHQRKVTHDIDLIYQRRLRTVCSRAAGRVDCPTSYNQAFYPPIYMIPRITIAEAGKHVGETVEIAGWLYNLRRSGKIAFPILRDGYGVMQCVAVKANLPEELFETIKNLTQESSIIVTGKIREEQRAPGGYEMDVENLEVMQRVPEADPYPITPKEHGIDFLMDHRHLWLRSQRQHAILRVRHEVIKAVRDYFDSHGFTLVDTPIFTPAACEGTTTLFEVNYFDDEKAYLTQSGQLYNEATAMAFGKTYCFGPTFRAEKSKTRRHLTEFWMVEPEMAYATLEDVKRVAEELIVFIVGRVLENRREELKRLERDVTKLEAIQAPFPRMSYDDAVKILQAKGSEIQWGGDFGGTDETMLTEDQTRPIMVDRFPAAIKAFYLQPDAERPEVALGVDVLAPEGYGEIIGGGQRIHDPELLLKRIEEHHLPREAFEWYIDLRKYGTRAARRLRHGHRALRRLDLRPGAHPRNHRVSAHALPAAAVRPDDSVQTCPTRISPSSARRSISGRAGAASTWDLPRCASPT